MGDISVVQQFGKRHSLAPSGELTVADGRVSGADQEDSGSRRGNFEVRPKPNAPAPVPHHPSGLLPQTQASCFAAPATALRPTVKSLGRDTVITAGILPETENQKIKETHRKESSINE